MVREFTEYNYSPRRKDKKVDSKTNAICIEYDYGKVYKSYAEEIGILIGEVLVATKKKWSRTTTSHQSYMHRDAGHPETVYLDHEDFREFVRYCRHKEVPTLGQWKRFIAQTLLSAR
jgi:hypothetical protein